MTMTDEYHQTDHYAGDSATGERGAARRRTRNTDPEYKNSILARPEIRALLADMCDEKVRALQETGEFGAQFVVHQLDEVVNELRGA